MQKNYRDFSGLLRHKSQLNPVIFNPQGRIHEEVREFIVSRAYDFLKALGITKKDALEDVRLTGGNASFTYTSNSDLDVTLMLNRNLDLSKQEIQRLGIACSLLNYKLNPQVAGIDLNYFISSRNVGGTRPAQQAIYSLFENQFIKRPTKYHESHANHIAAKANYFADIIENCLLSEEEDADKCAFALLQKLKRYRAKGLASDDGEFSTANAVWRVLSRSGYITKLKEKVTQAKIDHYKLKLPKVSLLNNDDYRSLIGTNPGTHSVPTSIVSWDKRIRNGASAEDFIRRVEPVISLFDDDGTK